MMQEIRGLSPIQVRRVERTREVKIAKGDLPLPSRADEFLSRYDGTLSSPTLPPTSHEPARQLYDVSDIAPERSSIVQQDPQVRKSVGAYTRLIEHLGITEPTPVGVIVSKFAADGIIPKVNPPDVSRYTEAKKYLNLAMDKGKYKIDPESLAMLLYFKYQGRETAFTKNQLTDLRKVVGEEFEKTREKNKRKASQAKRIR